MEQSIWELLNGAWGTLWIICGFSVIVLAIFCERLIALWRFRDNARLLSDTVGRCLSRGALDEGRSACERSRSPLADVYLVGYERLGRVEPNLVDTAVHRERVRMIAGLRSYLWLMGTIGAAAPFVGLFGTVVGIMGGFTDLKDAEASGQDVGIGVISGSISEALIATAAGIGVAVIAVMLYNYFNQRLARINLEIKMLTDEFLEELHPHAEAREPDADERPRRDAPSSSTKSKSTARKSNRKSESTDDHQSSEAADGARKTA